MLYVFLGAYSEVIGAGIKLTRFGERVELPAEIAENCKQHGGLPCIPAEQFDAIGFTAQELKKYAVAASHDRDEPRPDGSLMRITAAPEFLEKKRKALAILHDIREAPAAAPVEAVSESKSEGGS